MTTAPYLLFDSDGDDLQVFRTLDALTRYVESPDLANYLVVDACGRTIALSTNSVTVPGRNGVAAVDVLPVIASATGERLDEVAMAERLRTRLRKYGIAVSGDESAQVLLPMLVVAAGYTD